MASRSVQRPSCPFVVVSQLITHADRPTSDSGVHSSMIRRQNCTAPHRRLRPQPEATRKKMKRRKRRWWAGRKGWGIGGSVDRSLGWSTTNFDNESFVRYHGPRVYLPEHNSDNSPPTTARLFRASCIHQEKSGSNKMKRKRRKKNVTNLIKLKMHKHIENKHITYINK